MTQVQMTKPEYELSTKENIDRVNKEMSDSVEKGHIISILKNSIDFYYPDKPEPCIWTNEPDEDSSFFETSCKQAFTLNDGNTEDNNINFCHFCGKPVKEEEQKYDDD